ncbi:MAG: starch-binding protein [Ruminococcus sp.]|nr:starch-binding protein [Ruminococcus sp.]
MSKTKKIISLLITVALIMTMATVAIVSTSAAVKVYFEDSLNWGNIHAYCYGGDGELLGPWVGTACTDEGDGIWSIELSGTPETIIFHANDDATQTSNIPFAGDGMIAKLTGEWAAGEYGKTVAVAEFVDYEEPGDDDPADGTTAGDVVADPTTTGGVDTPVDGETITVYFTNNWAFATQNIYWWKGEENCGEWPGVAMTAAGQNGAGEDVYSAEVPADAEGIIFSGIDDRDGETLRQTVDITDFADGKGFFCKEEVTGDDGKVLIAVESYDYNPGGEIITTTVDGGEIITTTVDGGEIITTTVDGGEIITTTVGGDDTPAETGIDVAGTTYDVPAGTTVTYKVDLTAARLFENIQAFVSYDSTKLELVRIKSDDPDVADWEVEGPVRCPNLDGVIFNAGTEGLVKFNSSKVSGYNFKEENVLVTLEFVVKDTAKNTIALTIEEMTIKGDGTESYFTGGQAVITEGITVVESLDYVGPTTTVTTSEITTVTEPKTTVTEPKTTVTEPKTTVTEPKTTVTEPKTTVTVPDPSTDPSNIVGTTPSGGVDTPPTGAAAYIYIAIAIMAMVACAVVVLRKKAND